MAEKRKNSWLVRFFWPLAIVVVVVVVAIFVVGLKLANKQEDSVEKRLNERYEQKIELKSESTSGNRYRTRVYIDGQLRDDCSERDAELRCSEDPQPTLERSPN